VLVVFCAYPQTDSPEGAYVFSRVDKVQEVDAANFDSVVECP